MKTLELKKDFYWLGVLDSELRVFDIIMQTEFGTTYNSYLLKAGDKTVLFETAKEKFFDEYLEKVKELTELSKIDYLVLEHTEPDHVGSVSRLIELNPNIKVVATATAINFLSQIINRDFYSIAVKDGETLQVGDKTLRFMVLPNLHWPDTMYTYVEEDNLLITCDSFGAHYSFEDVLRSKVVDTEGYMRAAKYYFDNIIGPFKPFMLKALDRIDGLPVDMICTGHGPVLDSNIEEMKEIYRKWCTVVNPNTKKTVVMPYVSAYGYTKELAGEIGRGIRDSGDVEVRAYDMVEEDAAAVMDDIFFADGLLFGTPTILGEALKPIWDLTTSMFPGVHGKKLASAFGSYGWSGEGVPHLLERLKQLRMKVVDGFKIKFKPSERELLDAYEYGYQFGCVLQNKENPRKKAGGRTLVKCLVCGAVFDSSLENCPVCNVGRENFIPVEADDVTFREDTKEIYLVLGNGAAGDAAAQAIRERNATCSIVMVSAEEVSSYNRPMLTKSMLANFNSSQIAIHDEAWYQEQNIYNMLGKKVVSLDPEKREVMLDDGIKLSYHKCIYALGAESFIPPVPGKELDGVFAIRSIKDAESVNAKLPGVREAVVIGGGVLGLEAAWELSKSGCSITVLEAAGMPMARQLDEGGAGMIQTLVEAAGIRLMLSTEAQALEGDGHVTGVRLKNGEVLPAQMVIFSCGIRANVALAKDAGIVTERAIVVNERMETNFPGLYACGDCAQYNGVNFGIWPQAIEQGKVAGANAAGDMLSYTQVDAALTFNGMKTSLYAVGDNGKNPDHKYRTVEFKDMLRKTYEKYYFYNNGLAGAILIGDTKKLAEVTKAVAEKRPFKEMF